MLFKQVFTVCTIYMCCGVEKNPVGITQRQGPILLYFTSPMVYDVERAACISPLFCAHQMQLISECRWWGWGGVILTASQLTRWWRGAVVAAVRRPVARQQPRWQIPATPASLEHLSSHPFCLLPVLLTDSLTKAGIGMRFKFRWKNVQRTFVMPYMHSLHTICSCFYNSLYKLKLYPSSN